MLSEHYKGEVTRLRQIRTSQSPSVSQEDVASALGIPQSTYSRIESCVYTASAGVADQIAHYFGVDLAEIFDPAIYRAIEAEEEQAA